MAGLGGTVVIHIVWVGPSVLGGLVVAAGLLGGVWWSGLSEKGLGPVVGVYGRLNFVWGG